ncbi:small nuclear ribonucleoprotein E (nucleomorph) [Chroomonas mesostigmatica CCMP1168]|uniref:Sm protein E n=1 Tax=Chroomonas mesostigmatica CCMP1168 TaxID=1195612 RepID=J7G2Q1_9CRYP|nr:small nuclear ribonucleoprotein E [Chroomonas mesostigmatica CCMP1168]|mmetsp:Transcript_16785/g.41028  ORF Transcript_16785/g.41028 Transcript_16785/m.41028 type:complete len:83 (-) Transcript_16785:1645-1893(-)
MISQPINLLFRFFQNRNLISITLQNAKLNTIIGIILGFDEFMNIVLENAFEINSSGKNIFLGHIMIKGDCIAIISDLSKLSG